MKQFIGLAKKDYYKWKNFVVDGKIISSKYGSDIKGDPFSYGSNVYAKHKIKIQYDSAAVDLVYEENSVSGVEILNKNKIEKIYANKEVILWRI